MVRGVSDHGYTVFKSGFHSGRVESGTTVRVGYHLFSENGFTIGRVGKLVHKGNRDHYVTTGGSRDPWSDDKSRNRSGRLVISSTRRSVNSQVEDDLWDPGVPGVTSDVNVTGDVDGSTELTFPLHLKPKYLPGR